MKKKDYLYLSIIGLIILGFAGFLLIKGYVFGSTIDWSNQHIVIPEYFRNLFYKDGNLIPTFALNLGMGQNIFYMSYYGLLSPIILISYLLPFIPMYIYIPCVCILISLISAFMFYKWIKSKYDSDIAFVASLLFILNAPLAYHYHRHIMFVIYMPFMLGALKSVDLYFDKKNPKPLILYTFLMIMTSYYFSVSGIITIGIYTLYKLIQDKKIEFKDFKPLWKVIFYVIVGILLSGVLLIPTIYSLINGRISTSISINYSFLELLLPKINFKYTFYNSYYSWGITFIYIISLVNGIISKKKNNIFLSIILGMFILFPICSYLLNGLMYIDGKCFIPFIPVALLVVCNFIKSIKEEKVVYKKLFYVLIPVIVFMLYCSIGTNNIPLMLGDIALAVISLWIMSSYKKPLIIIIPTIIIAALTFGLSADNETYMTRNQLMDVNNKAYYDLADIKDEGNLYRSANMDNILLNTDKIYNTNNLQTSIYSSSSNKNYFNFVRNTFQNEVVNRDNTTITQTSNLLFNIYSGTKYVISSEDALLGYKNIKEENGIKLYKNDDVLPIGYASNKIMSLREFQTLKYPYTIDALLNYVIVDKSLENVYESNVNEYTAGYTLGDVHNMDYNFDNNHYIINANNKANLSINLNEEVNNKVLIIKFNMNKAKEGNACSTNVTINGITNALSCKSWKYNNKNNTFEYVISSNEAINSLNIKLTSGEFDISNIKLYTIDYNDISDIKNNINEMIIDQTNSSSNKIVGKINASNDGYVKVTIPYETQGFKIFVDGKRVAKVKTDNAFLGFEITKGEHNIEIEYMTPYLKLGMVISGIGILLLIGVIIYHKIYKTLEKIWKKIKNYLNWIYKKIGIFLIENKGYVYLFISMFILDLALRIFYSVKVNYYEWYYPVPNMYSIIWILLVLNLTKLFKKRIGNVIYLIAYIFSIIMFLVHAIYFSYFNLYFDYSVMRVAGEGADYYETVLLNIKYWVVIVSILSVYMTIIGLKNIKHEHKFNYVRFIIVLGAFALIKCGLPLFLGAKSTSIEWDDWRNARSVYTGFNDNNKSMMVAGMYEYNIRNFYVNFIRNNEELSKDEEKVLKDNFADSTINSPNSYTGLLKGKNLILVQMESLDDFLVTKKTMPTLYGLTKNSINFKNHYSFTSGGGSTFNSEFMVNTGYSSAYNYNQSGYSFSRNTYTYSLANLFKNLGYRVNAFHMNTSEYYSRGVNYKAFGYDNYYGLKDMDMYDGNTNYWLDTELIKNGKFNEEMFKDGLFVDYIITYSAHMPYKTTKGTCAMLTDEEGLTEEECLDIQARETDDMIKLLIKNLDDKGLLDNTAVVLFSDHYIYTLEDESLLDKYKTTNNNLINHTPFIIYNNGQTVKTVKSVNSQLDILPTILNLYGIDYYPNNYIGRDILSKNYDPLVFFSDGSWYNGYTYVANGEYQSGRKMNQTKIDNYNSIVKKKMLLNDAIIKSNYFAEKDNS